MGCVIVTVAVPGTWTAAWIMLTTVCRMSLFCARETAQILLHGPSPKEGTAGVLMAAMAGSLTTTVMEAAALITRKSAWGYRCQCA